MTQNDCIFCQIVAGRASASIVYHDEVCTAFMDIQPINAGHVLVVLNQHATYLADLDTATGEHLFGVGQRVAAALRASGARCEGVICFWQTVPPPGRRYFTFTSMSSRATLAMASALRFRRVMRHCRSEPSLMRWRRRSRRAGERG